MYFTTISVREPFIRTDLKDIVHELFKKSDEMGMVFATDSLHNSCYFVKAKNIIKDRPMVSQNFENLVNEFLCSYSPKNGSENTSITVL